MLQIFIENNIIKRIIDGNNLYPGFIEVPYDFSGRIGDRIDDLYKENIVDNIPEGYKLENGELLPMSKVERIKNGIDNIPEGYKLEKDNLIEMSFLEKIKNGIDNIPKGYKLENGELIQKTIKEQYQEKEITKEQYSNLQRDIRNSYLYQTDKYMLADFPIDENKRQIIKDYRKKLRDITTLENFPDVEIPKVPIL